MGVTAKEMREYARGMLRRKTFRFHRINGMIDNRMHTVLDLAKSFAASSRDGKGFLRALHYAPEELKERIAFEFEASRGGGEPERLELIRNIQGHIIAEGVFTDFGRPASVGLILESRELDGISLFFALGESHPGSALRTGRAYFEKGRQPMVLIYLWDALARVAETLDLLVSTRDIGEEGNSERALYRSRAGDLSKWCASVRDSEWVPGMSPEFFIFAIAIRSVLSGLESVAGASESPREMLRSAVNIQLDCTLAHEISQVLEREADGSLPFDKETSEIFGYLLQAVHSRPDYAYLSMVSRHFDFRREMPDLVEDLRSRGAYALLEGPQYLRSFAEDALERKFRAFCGISRPEALRTDRIRSVQSTDYMRPEHMPLIEKAMCNPSYSQPV